jgi:hypothetical protein
MAAIGHRNRVLLGSVGLLAGLAVLAGGLFAVYRFGGITESGLEPWGWVAVALVGLVFVHLQVLGAAAMVSQVLSEVTAKPRGPSVNRENEQ